MKENVPAIAYNSPRASQSQRIVLTIDINVAAEIVQCVPTKSSFSPFLEVFVIKV